MRSAILTDIHANRAAFEAVLADLTGRSIERIVFLGDLVGQGPDVQWVLNQIETMVNKGAALALRGNHDRFSAADKISPHARRIVDWTVNQLSARNRLFLEELPLTIHEADRFFAHASAHAPQDWHYVKDRAAAKDCLMASPAQFTFVGHCHVPALWAQDVAGQVRSVALPGTGAMKLDDGQRWVAVIGPVSDPRDGSTAAQYAIFDDTDSQLQFCSVGYDADLTALRARAAGQPLARLSKKGA